MSPPGIEPGLPQPQCGVIATIRRRQDMIIQKKRNSYHKNKFSVLIGVLNRPCQDKSVPAGVLPYIRD